MKILIIALLLSGCAVFNGGIERSYRLSQLSGVYIGMSTEQVKNLWGMPTRVNRSAYSTVWIYRNYRGRILGTQRTYVYFDKSGRVTNWSGTR